MYRHAYACEREKGEVNRRRETEKNRKRETEKNRKRGVRQRNVDGSTKVDEKNDVSLSNNRQMI